MADSGPSTASKLLSTNDNSKISRSEGRGYSNDHQRGRGRGRGASRGNRGNDRGGRQKKTEMGRGEWGRDRVDKRTRNDEDRASKRQRISVDGKYGLPSFSKEEISGEERKPKRKVAVLIGYAGSGYNGMQINDTEKTIEGELFKAFVAAGAISKANADDPKKSALVRCARTDKGVHAAGNVVSLKLIVEDPEIVDKINAALPSQIRVWGIERTNGSFSCYQSCDSRWYEYLIPTYSLLPPHPNSFLGRRLVESAEEEGLYESYQSRQQEVSNFWEEAEKEYVKPVLDRFDPELRAAVLEAIQTPKDESKGEVKEENKLTETLSVPDEKKSAQPGNGENITADVQSMTNQVASEPTEFVSVVSSDLDVALDDSKMAGSKNVNPLDAAIKEVKAAYMRARKAYRISSVRRQRLQDTLNAYVGTHTFYNYTIQKSFQDPSAIRLIRSFNIGTSPIVVNGAEWLSLKVHGQSFMMHQIRKMVAMAALVVRCGCSVNLINDSYGPDRISIPKAPGLGLLLERPVFDSYNKRATEEFDREKIDFDKFTEKINDFKKREIYDRIFNEEEREHQFNAFFHHIDTFKSDYFSWVTAKGISAAKQSLERGGNGQFETNLGIDFEDEADAADGDE